MAPQTNLFVIQAARDAVLQLPGISAEAAAAARISSLKGLSNLSFLVELPHQCVVVRLAQPGIGSYANRSDEIAASRLASDIGLGPRLLLADASTGLLVSDYVAHASPPWLAGAAKTAPAIERMGSALGSLHRCGRTLPGRYDVFAVIAEYRSQVRRAGRALPHWPVAVDASLAAAQAALATRPLSACHNDPVPENFLFAGPRTLLVDWEYAGMNDPAFDLAYLSLEAALSAAAERRLLSAHGDADTHAPLLPLYKFLICVMTALWGRLHAPETEWQAWAAQREVMAVGFAEKLKFQ